LDQDLSIAFTSHMSKEKVSTMSDSSNKVIKRNIQSTTTRYSVDTRLAFKVDTHSNCEFSKPVNLLRKFLWFKSFKMMRLATLLTTTGKKIFNIEPMGYSQK
jgi:hypothetical protein